MNATTPAPEYGIDVTIGTGSIYARIARVQRTVRNMPKNKTAKIKMKAGGEYSFDYIDKGALEAECRQLFSAEGVALLPSEETITQSGNRCIVTVALTLAIGPAPEEQVTLRRSGYGGDDADKGPAKAGTTAMRLLLADLLLQGGDDVAEHDYVEYRPHVAGQAAQEGDLLATTEQLKLAGELVCRAQLDRAMPTAQHAVLRLARSIVQQDIAPGQPVPDAIHLIPRVAMSKLIEKLEKIAENPKGAKAVWDGIEKWETDNGFAKDLDPPPTNALGIRTTPQPTGGDDSIPF